LWKSLQCVVKLPLAETGIVHRIAGVVDFRALWSGAERFTSFLIMNILGKSLTSTETIAKLVEKPVQISVRLAQFRNLINRV
jgi:hypothetical protein